MGVKYFVGVASLGAVVFGLLLYVAFVYGTGEINPMRWEQDLRFIHAVLAATMGPMLGFVAIDPPRL